jgi:hypothetical protein
MIVRRFIDISPALITVNHGRIYEQMKYDPSLIVVVEQENYSKQAVALASFLYNYMLIELSQIEPRNPIIDGLIRRYNEALASVDEFYKTGIEGGEAALFDKKRLSALKYDNGPMFALLPPGSKFFKASVEQYQHRILQIYLAEDLFRDVRIEIRKDPTFETVYQAVEEFELYMWKKQCIGCNSNNVKFVEEGTNRFWCAECAAEKK